MIRVALHCREYGRSYPVFYTIEQAEAEWGYCVKDLTKRIEALNPGETFTDEAGDVWERLS